MSGDAYDALARDIVASGVLTDPWLDGKPRFDPEPIVLSSVDARVLAAVAESIGALYDEMCRIVRDDEPLLERFFGMTPFQRAMWLGSMPAWHGIARVDAFSTTDGIVVSEINCDTPTGEAEAVVLGEIARRSREHLVDPNRDLGARFVRMVDTIADRMLDEPSEDGTRSIGLVYPTELTEDLSLVRLYKRWLEARGHRVVLGSPYNLEHDGERTRLFDAPIDVLVRHYKTDWWGERQSAWDDDDLPDKEPLVDPLRAAVAGMADGRLAVVNPFGSVLPQNKRAMAFLWEHIHRFSPRARRTIERHVPPTTRLEAIHPERLVAEQRDWVIKSDYGAEGDEVIVGRVVGADAWRATIEHARPGRWIAQRYFDAKVDERGATTNLGIFLVAGRAAGFYARKQIGPTDASAVSAPVVIAEEASIR